VGCDVAGHSFDTLWILGVDVARNWLLHCYDTVALDSHSHWIGAIYSGI
jgi:hypothetical protein